MINARTSKEVLIRWSQYREAEYHYLKLPLEHWPSWSQRGSSGRADESGIELGAPRSIAGLPGFPKAKTPWRPDQLWHSRRTDQLVPALLEKIDSETNQMAARLPSSSRKCHGACFKGHGSFQVCAPPSRGMARGSNSSTTRCERRWGTRAGRQAAADNRRLWDFPQRFALIEPLGKESMLGGTLSGPEPSWLLGSARWWRPLTQF
jgi:hypothetical protein